MFNTQPEEGADPTSRQPSGTGFPFNFIDRSHRCFSLCRHDRTMTIALRKQRLATLPHISFGPFRFLHALPWLMLAAAMRFMAGNGWGIALPATIIAHFCVLYAFLVTAQRSIEI